MNKIWIKKVEYVDKKIPDVSGLVKFAVLNAKTSKRQNKVPNIRGLVKTTDHNAKISDIEKKCLVTSD